MKKKCSKYSKKNLRISSEKEEKEKYQSNIYCSASHHEPAQSWHRMARHPTQSTVMKLHHSVLSMRNVLLNWPEN